MRFVTDPAVVEILASAARALGPLLGRLLLDELRDGSRAAVLERLARDASALDRVPSTEQTIHEMHTRHVARVELDALTGGVVRLPAPTGDR